VCTEDTPYSGGAFHLKLVLSQDFPNSPPRGFFLTRIYHPNISHTGDICVNTLKRDWNADLSLTHVLQVRTSTFGVGDTMLMLMPGAGHPLPPDRALPRILLERRGGKAVHGEL
jgi:hypothetical protein